MEVVVTQSDTDLILIDADVKNDVTLSNLYDLRFKILNIELSDEFIHLITIQPQSYSLGYELDGSNEKQEHLGRKFLFSKDIRCNEILVSSIIRSEEFGRGLLFIVICPVDMLNQIAQAIAAELNQNASFGFHLNCRIYYTENDGNRLCLFNSRQNKSEIDKLIAN